MLWVKLLVFLVVEEPLLVDNHIGALMMLNEDLDVCCTVDDFSSVTKLITLLTDALAKLVYNLSELLHVVLQEVYLSVIILLYLVEDVLIVSSDLVHPVVHLIDPVLVLLLRLLR